jgi:hypothetical protein
LLGLLFLKEGIQLEAPAFLIVKKRSEDAGGVEIWKTHEIDRPVQSNQCDGV